MDKPALRRWGRDRRRGIGDAARAAQARAVADRVLAMPELAAPVEVLAYAAVGSEVPTAALLLALQAAGHRVALPRIDDVAAGRMTAVRVDADAPRAAGRCGVPAPPAGPPMPDPAVVLVPGVVFCPDTGARLGQGGGFYDRYLMCHGRALAVGLAFDAQCSARAAALARPHDRAVHVLVTASRVRRFGGPG